MHQKRRWAAVSGLVLASGLFGGCAVTPRELEQAELAAIAEVSIAGVAADQEPVTGVIDLYEAIARAMKYNLDHQVEIAEEAVRGRELDLAHYSLLPTVVASSGYAARDRVSASSSSNVLTGTQSLATSTSQDKRLRTADIAFGWNVLDFGLSYVRARQAADKALIQRELRRKLKLRIIEEVRGAYWRAQSAQRLLGRLVRVEQQARDVERQSRTLASDGQTSPITALTYHREIVDVQRVIGEVQRDLNTAHVQLGAMMNIRPGTPFRVAEYNRRLPPVPGNAMVELLHVAVANRPELREVEYRKRINEHEAHAALLELLPGVNLLVGNNFDSNSFLLHPHWANWGAKASWNLIKVFSYPARRGLVEEQARLLDKKALAVTMAVMTQVYVSRIRLAHSLKEYRTAERYRNVQARLLRQIRLEADANRVARQTLVREELNAIVAEAKLDIAFAAVQTARANLHASLGIDPPDLLVGDGTPVKEIASAVGSFDQVALHIAATGEARP